MSVSETINKCMQTAYTNTETIFKSQRPDFSTAWFQAVITAVSECAGNYIGRQKTAAILFGIYEAIEQETVPPDIKHIIGKSPFVQLSRRERLSRWWADNSETFYAGMIAGMVVMGLLHWWASSV